MKKKASLRLEMRSQGSKMWREVTEDHHRVSIQVFLAIRICWARSAKPWQSEMQVLEILGVWIPTQRRWGPTDPPWVQVALQLLTLLCASFVV